MLQKIVGLLNQLTGINGYRVLEERTESVELFFVKKELDLNRSKKVQHFTVTVYRDFEEAGVQYKGSATASIHPTMSEAEIRVALKDAQLAAGFVKNRFYPLVKPGPSPSLKVENTGAESLLGEAPRLTAALLAADTVANGSVNSAELFLNRVWTRLITSAGIDYSFERYRGELEVITNWQEGGEEVELYRELNFTKADPELISRNIRELLELTKEKALARPTPSLKQHTVVLTGEPVVKFLSYYYHQTAARSIYEETSRAKLGESIQGEDVKGDLIALKLDPGLSNSTASAPFDEDGVPLETVAVIKDGRLVRIWGDNRFAHYLSLPPTGTIRNLVFSGGSKSVASLKAEPHLELATFSDFQMDSLTGDFGGEIRLGWYDDGKQRVPVTGGSISGNIREVEREMYFSSELQQINNFSGPKSIQLFKVAVTGA